MTNEEITVLAGHRIVSPWVMKLCMDVAKAEREALAKQEQGEPVAVIVEESTFDGYLRKGIAWNFRLDSFDIGTKFYTTPQQQLKPLKDEEADMFWNRADSETCHGSIEEFLNDEICQGFVEVGAEFTLMQAKKLADVRIKVTSVDEEECEAEYEIIEAAHGIKE